MSKKDKYDSMVEFISETLQLYEYDRDFQPVNMYEPLIWHILERLYNQPIVHKWVKYKHTGFTVWVQKLLDERETYDEILSKQPDSCIEYVYELVLDYVIVQRNERI